MTKVFRVFQVFPSRSEAHFIQKMMATLDEGNILMTFLPLCSSQMFGAARSVFRLKCTKAGKAFNSSLLGLKRKFVHP